MHHRASTYEHQESVDILFIVHDPILIKVADQIIQFGPSGTLSLDSNTLNPVIRALRTLLRETQMGYDTGKRRS